MTVGTHDPGGKVKVRLDDRVEGDAFFHGPNDCYRTWLSRIWSPARVRQDSFLPKNFVLWIGMNPSTADARHNDPTINREMDFSMAWGHDALVKCNVADYRATKPEMLLQPGVIPRSRVNLSIIRDVAKRADRIVCAWGLLHRSLVPFAIDVETALRDDGHALWCLGLTQNGSPRHPLYVKGDTPLVRFKEILA